MFFFFFFNDTATTEIYTLSLHDALPICHGSIRWNRGAVPQQSTEGKRHGNRCSEGQGGDARKLGEHRPGDTAEQEPRRLAQAVLPQALLQLFAVRSVRTRDFQLG